MKSIITIESRFEGSLLGLAVGDALGAFFEGKPADKIAEKYPTVKELIENPPPGELWYTDYRYCCNRSGCCEWGAGISLDKSTSNLKLWYTWFLY